MKFNSIAQSSLAVLSLMLTTANSFAATPAPGPAPYCIAVNGGFANSGYTGSTYVARNFTMPDGGKCNPWTGYTKTSVTVIFTTSGTACVSSDNLALTVSVSSADPDYLGAGKLAVDYLKMSRSSATDSFSGQDAGSLTGSADAVSCTDDLLSLPAIHD